MSYRNTNTYKNIINSGHKSKVLEEVDKIMRSRNFPKKFVDSISELGNIFINGGIAPKLLALASLIYLVSPIDLIPDFIPLIGFADDLLVVSIVLNSIRW